VKYFTLRVGTQLALERLCYGEVYRTKIKLVTVSKIVYI